MRQILIDAINQGNVRMFYLSREWRAKRQQIIERDNRECQRCKSKGRYSKSESVHHIKHLRYRVDLALSNSNLISLCNACHNAEHPEKQRTFEQKSKMKNVSSEKW